MDRICFIQEPKEQISRAMIAAGVPEDVMQGMWDHHQRRFRPEPKGFYTSGEYSKLLVANCMRVDDIMNVVEEGTFLAMGALMQTEMDYPVYFLDEGLCEDFMITDAPEQLPLDITLPEYGLIVLPRDRITSDTGSLVVLVYRVLNERDSGVVHQHDSSGRALDYTPRHTVKGFKNLCWVGIEDHGVNVGGIVGLRPEAGCYTIQSDYHVGLTDADLDREKREVAQVFGLLVNSLVYSQQNSPTEYTVGKGFQQKKKPKKAKYVNHQPLFIGEGHTPLKRERSLRSETGRKVKPHWRRGHWHRYRYGSGRKLIKMNFVAPTLINAGD